MHFDFKVLKDFVLNKLISRKINLTIEPDPSFYQEVLSIFKLLSRFSKEIQISLGALDNEYENFKLETSLTTSQLAYFIKVLIDTEIIITSSLKELFQFLADHIQTKDTVNLSVNSLFQKYLAPDESSKKIVESFLLEVLNEIDNLPKQQQ